jgi:hypothetical protein
VGDTGSKEKRQNHGKKIFPIQSANPISVTRTGNLPIPDDILVDSVVVQVNSREPKQ